MKAILNIGQRVDGASEDIALIEFGEEGPSAAYSYLEVQQQANAGMNKLRAMQLQPGAAIGILSDNSAAFVFLWLGALRAGLIVVPVNHKLSVASIEHILRDSSVAHVFFDEGRKQSVPNAVASTLIEALLPPCSEGEPPVVVQPESTAVVLYTSGSTGMPKGVPMTHGGYAWTIDSRLRGGPHSHHRLLVAAPLYHINALGAITFALAAGASVVLLPTFSARQYIEAIGRFGCTWLTSVPPMLAMVVREKSLLAATNLSTVKLVRMGSSPVSGALLKQVREVFPGATLSNGYGTTEGGPLVFGASPDGRIPPDGAAGWPIADVDVTLRNAQGQDVAGEGILYLRTPATMKGYLNLPAKTNEVLSEDGWYCTADIFRRDENGAFWFVSRADDMFVCGGENIHPQEVERVLESHPDVLQACVVPIADDVKGTKPVAFVVRRAGGLVSESELKTYALANGPAYQHPRSIHFIDVLPLAGTNKVDRRALIQSAAAMAAAA